MKNPYALRKVKGMTKIMKNPNIAPVLKSNRISKKLSVKQVADILKDNDNYVATKTIYGWESGQTQPDADTLMLLCEIYGITNILETFGYHDSPFDPDPILTDREKLLIQKYRKNEEMHPAIHRLLQIYDNSDIE